MITVDLIPILQGTYDNYAYLLKGDNGDTAVLDPGEAAPIIAELQRQGLHLDYILNTHHHGDHINGNAELMARYNAQLIGPASETARIPNMHVTLSEGEGINFGGEVFAIIETPGHTSGHICFYAPQSGLLFSGDTLFSLGCGRIFDGTAEQLWTSIQKLAALPDDTKIYCGHEYTQANGRFGLTIEPDNEDLIGRMQYVDALRESGKPTLPSTIGLEKRTNIFLRAGSVEKFAELRTLKDKS